MHKNKFWVLFLALVLALSFTAPVFAESATLCTIKVAVVGPEGVLIYGSRSVAITEDNPFGVTALGALEGTGLDYDVTGDGSSHFVNSIAGNLAEGMSGWSYTVNDVSPPLAADLCAVEEGGAVIWYYSTSFDSPAPEWSDLEDQIPLDPLDLDAALLEIVSFYREHHTVLGNWEEVIALWGAGVDLTKAPWKLPDWEIEQLDEETPVTGYATTILGMLAAGEDPADGGGRNLIAGLIARQNADGSFGEGWLNEHVWSLIALDTVGGKYDTAAAIAFLLEQQTADGGFTLFGDEGDPDMTAMALIALAAHRELEGAEEAIAAALTCLRNLQQPGGGFASWGSESAESASAVIRALVACGEDPATVPWTEGGRGIIHALFAYQLEDGSFRFGDESNSITTCQALIAVGDLVQGNLFERLAAAYEPGRPGSVPDPEPAPESADDADPERKKSDLPVTTGGGKLLAGLGLVLTFVGFFFTRRESGSFR